MEALATTVATTMLVVQIGDRVVYVHGRILEIVMFPVGQSDGIRARRQQEIEGIVLTHMLEKPNDGEVSGIRVMIDDRGMSMNKHDNEELYEGLHCRESMEDERVKRR